MLQIYCSSITELPKDFFPTGYTKAQKLSLCGKVLAKSMVAKLSGLPEEEIRFSVEKGGKPFAENVPVFFNISHSGSLVVCAAGDIPVGIDLQKIKPVSYALAKRIFSEEERVFLFGTATPSKEDVDRLNRTDALQNWYRLWCGKEALSKYYGTGLSREHLNTSLSQMLKKDNLILSELFIKDGCCCAVIAKEPAAKIEMVDIFAK